MRLPQPPNEPCQPLCPVCLCADTQPSEPPVSSCYLLLARKATSTRDCKEQTLHVRAHSTHSTHLHKTHSQQHSGAHTHSLTTCSTCRGFVIQIISRCCDNTGLTLRPAEHTHSDRHTAGERDLVRQACPHASPSAQLSNGLSPSHQARLWGLGLCGFV